MMRGLLNVLLVTAVAIGAIAAVVIWPRASEDILPTSMPDELAVAGSAAAHGPEGERTGESPSDFRVDGEDELFAYGLFADGPVAALAGNSPVFIDDVIVGYSTRVAQDIPAEITKIRPIMGCFVTPPLKDTFVGHVVAGQSGPALGLVTYGDNDLAAAVQDFVDDFRAARTAETVSAPVPEDLVYQSYDVVVTETSVPVYLVLQTGPGNRIWNIHVAQGVRIERVVLLGGGQVGVANLDPVVPVEVILKDGLQACNINPVLPLNPGHRLLVAAASGDAEAQARLSAQELAASAYRQWFVDAFGIAAGPSRTGFDWGTVSLVGPVPGRAEPALTPKASFAAIAGSKIRTTQDTFFEIQGQVAEGEGFAARVKAIATTFAFGNLATLRQGAQF